MPTIRGNSPGPARPSAPSASGDVERLITALADPTRRRILVSLVRDGGSRTIDELAELAGVHRTVAFTHLERLADLGYLEKSQRRGRLGKPASLYAAKRGVLSFTYPPRQFVALASILAAGVNNLGDTAPGVAKAAGLRFGADAVHQRARSVVEALIPLDALGADYSVEGDMILAGNCIFLEACDQARAVVCSAQAGILEGALCGAGIEGTVVPEGPRSPRGCAYRLTRRDKRRPRVDGRGDAKG
jgi:predicted ArsR family transcriptional regulator